MEQPSKLSSDSRTKERAKSKADSAENRYGQKDIGCVWNLSVTERCKRPLKYMSAILQKGQCDVITNDVPHSKRQWTWYTQDNTPFFFFFYLDLLRTAKSVEIKGLQAEVVVVTMVTKALQLLSWYLSTIPLCLLLSVKLVYLSFRFFFPTFLF